MTPDLPPELWTEIFSYLGLEDLTKARRVCREWWDLINNDRLWKPLLRRRGITAGCVNLEKKDDADALQSCEWAQICFTYYRRVPANWRTPQYRASACDLSTEYILIRLPYMLTTYDPYRVVSVYRLVDGDFALSSRLPLPDDGDDGCFTPQMTNDSVFVVSKNAYVLIFKLNRCSFKFEKAVCLTADNNFVSCSTEEELSGFLRSTRHSALVACYSANDDALWISDEVSQVMYVWDYSKSELLFQFAFPSAGWARSTESLVYCVLPDQLSVHSPDGRRLFLYKRTQSPITQVSWDETGCGFIENRPHGKKFAWYYGAATNTLTELKVIDPAVICLQERLLLAHCLCLGDGAASIVTSSLETGDVLRKTVVCPSLQLRVTCFALNVDMRVVLGKYIVFYGIDGENPDRFISANRLSLYSLSEEKFLWSHPFNTGKITHLSEQFVVTRSRLPRGGMRYSFEICNFL